MLSNTSKGIANFIGGFAQGMVNAPANIHTITGAVMKVGTVAAEKLVSTGTSAAVKLMPQGDAREFMHEIGNGYEEAIAFEKQIVSTKNEIIDGIRESTLTEDEALEITL